MDYQYQTLMSHRQVSLRKYFYFKFKENDPLQNCVVINYFSNFMIFYNIEDGNFWTFTFYKDEIKKWSMTVTINTQAISNNPCNLLLKDRIKTIIRSCYSFNRTIIWKSSICCFIGHHIDKFYFSSYFLPLFNKPEIITVYHFEENSDKLSHIDAFVPKTRQRA